MTQESMSFVDFMTILGILFGGLYVWINAILSEKQTRSNLVSKLNSYDAMPFYRNWLTIILDKLDSTLGKPKISFIFLINNISFHYGLSILYIFIVFFIIWLFGGSNTIGALEILPKLPSKNEQFSLLLKLIIFISILKYTPLVSFLKKHIKSRAMQEIVTVVIVDGIAIAILIAGGTGAVAVAVIAALTIVIIVGMIRGILGAVGAVGGVVGAIIGSFFLIDKGNYLYNANSTLFIFFLLIPFLNTILDFLSLTLSRIFFRYISKGEAWYKIMIHLLLDLWLALLFMVGLLVLLYYSISYYNTLIDSSLHIPITQMLQNTLKDPFSLDNAWISFMVLSTLVPTVLHLIFALLNFILYVSKLAPWYANRIERSEYPSQRMFTVFIIAAPFTLFSMIVGYLVYLGFLKFMTFIV